MERTLLVITSDPAGPVVRHRFAAFGSALAKAGIRLELGPWPKRRRIRRETLARAARASGVVISSRLLSLRHLRALRSRVDHLAFDFDDALPFRDSRRGATRSWTRWRRFVKTVAASDRIVAGNRYLAGLAGEVGREAFVIPTVVPTPEGPPAPEPDDDVPIIGWIGSRATLPYLEARALVFSALVASGHAYRLRVIADREPRFPPGIMVESVQWTLDGWQARLAGTHFGLAPVPDDPWTRGKCGLKLLQTFSVGRPVVASAVGVQADQVREGETGYLASDREGFLEGIQRMMEDGPRRREMGAAGFQDVCDNWCVGAWATRFVEEVERLLAGETR